MITGQIRDQNMFPVPTINNEAPMQHLIDYVKWMKEIPFEALGFRMVDVAVFCQLCYADLSFLDPSQLPISVSDAYLAYTRAHQNKSKQLKHLEAEYLDLFTACAASKRFGPVLIADYQKVFDQDRSIQFAATAYDVLPDCPEGFRFLAYQGSDNSLAGWKENFMISFTLTEGQKLAALFARKNVRADSNNYIGGHSKGGNQALYAASQLPEDQLQALKQVYMLDGPGLCPDVLPSELLMHIEPLLTRIQPTYSVIGNIFEPTGGKLIIVKPSVDDMSAHVIHTWCIEHGEFLTADDFDPHIAWLNDTVNRWIENVTMDVRKDFVEELFASWTDMGMEYFTDLDDFDPFDFEQMVMNFLSIKNANKRVFLHLPLRGLFDDMIHKLINHGFWKALQENVLLQSGIAFLLGLLIMISSPHLLEVLLTLLFIAVAGFEIVVTIKHLKDHNWDFSLENRRITICIAMVFVVVWLYIKQEAFYIIGSILLAIIFLNLGYRDAVKATEAPHRTMKRLLYMVEAVACMVYGLSFLFSSEETIFPYAMSFGLALCMDAFLRLISWVADKRKEGRGH